MKDKATVIDIADPKSLGRIRVALQDDSDTGLTPWCWPCVPFAGPGYGFYCLPQVGDEVWVEQAAGGEFVWTGFYWNGRNQKPESGSADKRVLRTPVGHELLFDENGAIEVRHADGSTVVLEAGGDITVTASGKAIVTADQVELNGDSGNVVTTECICSYTGQPHPQGSKSVKAKGPF